MQVFLWKLEVLAHLLRIDSLNPADTKNITFPELELIWDVVEAVTLATVPRSAWGL